MEKNYLKAIVLSLVIVITYPMLMKWLAPNTARPVEVTHTAGDVAVPAKPLSPTQGTYLEPAGKPTTVLFENELFQLEFSTLGGTVTRLFYKGEPGRQELTKNEFFSTDPQSAGIFGVNILREKADLSATIFRLARRGEKNEVFEFFYQLAGEYEFVKTFTVREDRPVIDLVIQFKNLSANEKKFPAELLYGMDHEKDYQKNYGFYDAVAYQDKLRTADLNALKKKGFTVPEGAIWAGAIKKYFALLIKPNWKIETGAARADDKAITGSLTMEALTIPAGGQESGRFLIYAGLQRYEILKSFDCEFESILSRGFFGIFKMVLLSTLKFFYHYTHNFGWALVLLTLLIKLIFAPLTHMSYASMKKMQILSPKMKAIQAQNKNNPQKQQQELAALYRRNKVNPVMGCLPMLIQIPIFIAIFRLLPEAIELHGAPFIGWITDLSAPDKLMALPFTVPLLGWNSLNILPILMAASQVWYQKIMPQQPGVAPEQAAIMNLMPIFFGFICYNMPSGLTLYWTLQNLFSIIQQVFINRIVIVLHHEDQ